MVKPNTQLNEIDGRVISASMITPITHLSETCGRVISAGMITPITRLSETSGRITGAGMITPITHLSETGGLVTVADMSNAEDDVPFRPLYKFFTLFWQVVPPFILLPGIFGNVMIVVICRRSEVMPSMSVYFVTLACSDLMSLIVNIVNHWVYYSFDTDLLSLHSLTCKVIGWLIYVTGVLSAWILVAMTAQRTVCVLWPHRAHIHCSTRNSKAIVSTMTPLIAVLHCHLLYGLRVVAVNDGTHTTDSKAATFSSGGTHITENTTAAVSNGTRTTNNTAAIFNNSTHRDAVCVLVRDYVEFYFSLWSWMDLLIFSVLPWLCLVVSNSVLLWTLNVSIRQAQHSLGSAHTDGFSGRKKQASSMTVTLFAVSTAFIILNLPMSTVHVLSFFHYMTGSVDYFYQSEVIAYCNEIAIVMWQTNSAVNFYLYCLAGSKFRKELKKTFGCASPVNETRAATV